MRNRSVVEIMVIMFASVVAFMIALLGSLIAFLEIRDPETDTGDMTKSLLSVVSLILGALLGLLAGKSQAVNDLHKRPDDTENGIGDE